jgi:hypothetical protein
MDGHQIAERRSLVDKNGKVVPARGRLTCFSKK